MQGNDSFPFGIRVNSQSFKQIPEKLLEEARSNAYSLERREKQGGLEYLGSEIPGAQKRAGVDSWHVYDYFKDSDGDHWYQTRVLLPSGELISMEEWIFGHKIKKYKRKE